MTPVPSSDVAEPEDEEMADNKQGSSAGSPPPVKSTNGDGGIQSDDGDKKEKEADTPSRRVSWIEPRIICFKC